jgi:hypothetical protein
MNSGGSPAGHVLAPAALDQVPVLDGAVIGDVLVDCLGHVERQRDVAELSLGPGLEGPQLRGRVDLLADPQGGPPVDAAAGTDSERLADPQQDPLELLMRLRSVTAGRYAGDETIPSRTAARSPSTVSGTTAVFTVWVDNEYVWQIQAVTLETREQVVVIVLATTTVTAQLWDFGVPIDPMDWPALPRALTGYCP